IDAKDAYEFRQLMRCEYDRVEIDFLQIGARWVRQVTVRIRARPPGMVDPPRIGAQKSAAVNGQDLQAGVALKYAVENQIMQRDRGIERIADHIVEVEAREPVGLGESGRMDQNKRAEFFGLAPERGKCRVRQFPARNIGQDLDAPEAQRAHAAFELAC